MGGLEFILILLVPLGVWILSSIFKSDDDRPGARPGAGNRPTAQRRPVTDLERFLEEARRRREMAERRQEGEKRPVPQREARPEPSAERRPTRPPVPQRRKMPESPMQRTQRPPVLLEAVPDTPIPVSRALGVERPLATTVQAQAPLPESVAPVPLALAIVPLSTPVLSNRANPSPALLQLVELLRSPRAAGTAIVLREVFDRPLCKRGR